jgi:pimeloyl-ACP methyl ester carboxylesterase
MPFAELEGITLYYETYGDGNDRTIILINGLGSDHREWLYQIPAFKDHFRVIVFDNRGTGISDVPEGPYTTDDMAKDAVSLLRFLGTEKSHVLGVSMGGFIAQKVAILYPHIVDRLVLACTAMGGEKSIKPDPDALAAFASYDENDPEGSLRRVLPYLYTKEFIESGDPEIERFIRFALTKRQSREGYMNQMAAISTHSSYDDLKRIEAETLVITGTADRLIPPENSEILAREIKRSKLRLIEGAPHRLFAERREEFNRAVLEFLTEGIRDG